MSGGSGIKVVVRPATFTLVSYDASEISDLVAAAAGWVGLADEEIVVEVDEQVPLGAASVRSVDPIVLDIEGGAFEDPKRIRQLSPDGVQTVAVRLLARIADRRLPGFADAPGEDGVTIAQSDAWDVWALGRASRNGLEVNEQRWRYRFRNRHGFTDVADRAFDRLFGAADLSWADIVAVCDETAGSAPPAG